MRTVYGEGEALWRWSEAPWLAARTWKWGHGGYSTHHGAALVATARKGWAIPNEHNCGQENDWNGFQDTGFEGSLHPQQQTIKRLKARGSGWILLIAGVTEFWKPIFSVASLPAALMSGSLHSSKSGVTFLSLTLWCTLLNVPDSSLW